MQTHEIRSAYLEFFAARGHRVVPSSSLVPANDPTLLFTNAGMVQFKDAFTGRERPDYTRAASCQRCMRAGGKHNDLENVGYTGRHHTLFEMLGNFSFGDYYKEQAIVWAWEFITRVLELPKERIWITTHPDDAESRVVWVDKIGIEPARVVPHESNFWAMGDTGPCGPNSEVFYDLGADVPGGPPGSPDEEGDRYSEIWNLVFPQFDRAQDGSLVPLDNPGVDTGMGLERTAAVLQGGCSNYDNDLFERLLGAVAGLPGANARARLAGASMRVIADHARAAVFLVADGVQPSNEERGYVLRRIVRRALRHAHKLQIQGPLFPRLVAPVVDLMGAAYPEIRDRADDAVRVLALEEERFAETLKTGMALLERELARRAPQDGAVLSGELVFKLYDTHGFPADMTADVARERGLTIDHAQFDALMARQRERARAGTRLHFADRRRPFDKLVGMTTKSHVADSLSVSDEQVETEGFGFTGYERTAGDASVVALFAYEADVPGEVDALAQGGRGIVVLDATPFYAEAGGQVGDVGTIETTAGAVFRVADTTKAGSRHLHHGLLANGALRKGDCVRASIDSARRTEIALNHSATHLLHAALKQVLGNHVEQKGSLVAPDRLRFDFGHPHPVAPAQLRRIAAVVNTRIRENTAVRTQEMVFGEAMKLGAAALFGEKYGERVRVLTMGEGFSVELCGGTHVSRTGDIGLLRIVSEEGVAAGVRRVEAVTGAHALAWLDESEDELGAVGDLVRGRRGELADKVRALAEQAKAQRRELAALRARLAATQGAELAAQAQAVGGVKVLAVAVEGDANALLPTMDSLRDRLGDAVVVLAHIGPPVRLVCGVGKGVARRVSAGDLVRFVAPQVGARGGGRPDMAQAGGGDRPENVPDALASVAEWVRERVEAA